MAIKPRIGEIAGEIWQILSNDGPQTLAQIKKKVGESNEYVSFAIGWLARENKVEITQDKKNFKMELK